MLLFKSKQEAQLVAGGLGRRQRVTETIIPDTVGWGYDSECLFVDSREEILTVQKIGPGPPRNLNV